MSQSQTSGVQAVICIPTFRRPDWLAKTLNSLKAQSASFGFAVVVIDNDAANPSGAEAALRFFEETSIPHHVAVEKNQGNCHAINRAFSDARAHFPQAEFFLMIDDDETADPAWLKEMVDTAQATGADIVGGPVRRTFDRPSHPAAARHPLFQSIEGPSRHIDQIHGTGNCLIRRRVFDNLKSPDFDLRYNFLGGGDMDFFTRCRNEGFTSWWCGDAVAFEFVPDERTRAGFLMKRSIRTGSINYVIDRVHGMSAARAVIKNTVSLGLGLIRSASLLLQSRSLLIASHPILMSIGRVYASFGSLPEPYKAGNTQEAPGPAYGQDLSS